MRGPNRIICGEGIAMPALATILIFDCQEQFVTARELIFQLELQLKVVPFTWLPGGRSCQADNLVG